MVDIGGALHLSGDHQRVHCVLCQHPDWHRVVLVPHRQERRRLTHHPAERDGRVQRTPTRRSTPTAADRATMPGGSAVWAFNALWTCRTSCPAMARTAHMSRIWDTHFDALTWHFESPPPSEVVGFHVSSAVVVVPARALQGPRLVSLVDPRDGAGVRYARHTTGDVSRE
jgi:hypothetical protein